MSYPDTLPPPERLDPERLTILLEEAGWKLVGGRRGVYNRLAPPHLKDQSGLRGGLVVPLDKTAPEYSNLMTAAVAEVSGPATRDLWERVVEPRIVANAADQFQFRRESHVPAGMIPWRQGEQLIKAARATLSAGAKSYVAKMRRYNNSIGQFSTRFLDTILMGQTAVGSYIVTAYAPTSVAIPISAEATVNSRNATGREVSTSVVSALEATVEALEHFRRTNSLSGFDEGVNRGVSYELSTALEWFARDAEGGDINVYWEGGGESERTRSAVDRFEFDARDAPLLSTAAIYLAQDLKPVIRVTVVGRVHLLTKKEFGSPGVFGLTSVTASQRKFRVRLSDEADYHWAVKAHDEDRLLAVNGILERDGNLSWLYHADILDDAASVDDISLVSTGYTVVEAQPDAQSPHQQLSFDLPRQTSHEDVERRELGN